MANISSKQSRPLRFYLLLRDSYGAMTPDGKVARIETMEGVVYDIDDVSIPDRDLATARLVPVKDTPNAFCIEGAGITGSPRVKQIVYTNELSISLVGCEEKEPVFSPATPALDTAYCQSLSLYV